MGDVANNFLTGAPVVSGGGVTQGFEFLMPAMEQLISQGAANTGIDPRITQLGNMGTLANLGGLSSLIPQAIGGLGQSIQGLGQLGQGNLGNFGDLSGQITDLLMPAQQRQFDQGSANIREQAALSGNLASTGFNQATGQLQSDLAAQTGQQTAGLLGSLIPSTQQSQLGAFGNLAQLPGMIQQIINAPTQFQGQQGLGSINAGAGLLAGTPIDAPIVSNPKQDMMSAAASVGSAAML